MTRRTTTLALFAASLTALGLFAARPAAGDGERPTPSLAFHMGQLQRNANKLGYAIQGKNKRLATYYAEKLGEANARMKAEVPSQDGIKVAQFSGMMLDPQVKRMTKTIEGGDWGAIGKRYNSLIQGCNGCHSATKHDFIEVKPVSGTNPYNQSF